MPRRAIVQLAHNIAGLAQDAERMVSFLDDAEEDVLPGSSPRKSKKSSNDTEDWVETHVDRSAFLADGFGPCFPVALDMYFNHFIMTLQINRARLLPHKTFRISSLLPLLVTKIFRQAMPPTCTIFL